MVSYISTLRNIRGRLERIHNLSDANENQINTNAATLAELADAEAIAVEENASPSGGYNV